MPPRLPKSYSAPSLGPAPATGSVLYTKLHGGSVLMEPVKRQESRKIMLMTERSSEGLFSEPLETQSADAFMAKIGRETVRKKTLLEARPLPSFDVPFWMKKERKINVWR
eukprot:TRINITY_DN58290_c0_g1_i1.p1 TRINITY_DN58290_c0_g1~~TRINITY_DN58290_c0_g1_i1.p1  ORF type:complete len:121 (+),score=13.57 TRINITY_DN58290_c0_g1_i1:34-363(+)